MSTRAHLNLESIFFFEALEYGAGLLKKNFNKMYFSRKFWVLSLFFSQRRQFFYRLYSSTMVLYYIFYKCTVRITAARASPDPRFLPGVLFGSELRSITTSTI